MQQPDLGVPRSGVVRAGDEREEPEVLRGSGAEWLCAEHRVARGQVHLLRRRLPATLYGGFDRERVGVVADHLRPAHAGDDAVLPDRSDCRTRSQRCHWRELDSLDVVGQQPPQLGFNSCYPAGIRRGRPHQRVGLPTPDDFGRRDRSGARPRHLHQDRVQLRERQACQQRIPGASGSRRHARYTASPLLSDVTWPPADQGAVSWKCHRLVNPTRPNTTIHSTYARSRRVSRVPQGVPYARQQRSGLSPDTAEGRTSGSVPSEDRSAGNCGVSVVSHTRGSATLLRSADTTSYGRLMRWAVSVRVLSSTRTDPCCCA